jgi:hypothetical protein
MSNKKQTAVDWLIEELGEYFPIGISGIEIMVLKAKEIEKKQIIDAYRTGFLSDDIKLASEYFKEKFVN